MKPIRSPLRWPLGLGSHAWPRRGVARRLAVGTEAMRGDGSITAMSCIALLKDIRLQSIHPYCERIKREQSEELLFKRRHGRQGSQRKSIISTRSYQFNRLMVGDQVAPTRLHWISGVHSNFFMDACRLWPFLSSWTSYWN